MERVRSCVDDERLYMCILGFVELVIGPFSNFEVGILIADPYARSMRNDYFLLD